MRARLSFVVFGLAIGLVFNAVVALAWTGPTASAPNSNVSAPLNVGTTAQVKNGDVGVNNVSAFGNALLSGLGVGTGRYLNFDYTTDGTSGTGSSGYGIRDSAGTLEFKNVGGSWASLQSLAFGASQWTTGTGGAIYYNGGNVGIGTASPSAKLHIAGGDMLLTGSETQILGSTYPSFSGWTNSTQTSVCGSTGMLGGYNRFGSGATTQRTLSGLAAGTYRVTFNYYHVDSWDETEEGWFEWNGEEYWDRMHEEDGSNVCGNSGYEDSDGLGYSAVTVYVTHDGGDATLRFGSDLNESSTNESWGVNNITVAQASGGTAQAAAFIYSSDSRLKERIASLKDGLAKLMQLNPVSFVWKEGPRIGATDIGFIAQDVEKLLPQIVHTDAGGMKSVDYPKLIPLLVKAIQEQQAEIEELKTTVREQRARIEALETQLAGI